MKPKKAKGFSYRPQIDHAARLNDLIEATERDKAFFLDKALDSFLPELEKRYAHELAEYRAGKKTYPAPKPHAHGLNDAISSPSAGGSHHLAAEIVGIGVTGAASAKSGPGAPPPEADPAAGGRSRHRSKSRRRS